MTASGIRTELRLAPPRQEPGSRPVEGRRRPSERDPEGTGLPGVAEVQHRRTDVDVDAGNLRADPVASGSNSGHSTRHRLRSHPAARWRSTASCSRSGRSPWRACPCPPRDPRGSCTSPARPPGRRGPGANIRSGTSRPAPWADGSLARRPDPSTEINSGGHQRRLDRHRRPHQSRPGPEPQRRQAGDLGRGLRRPGEEAEFLPVVAGRGDGSHRSTPRERPDRA